MGCQNLLFNGRRTRMSTSGRSVLIVRASLNPPKGLLRRCSVELVRSGL